MQTLSPPRFLLSFLFPLFLLAGTAVAGTEVFILHTNNTNGALENCLCPGKSYGSLEKRVLYVRQWLRDHPNTVILDGGDFLSATSNTLKDSVAFRAYEMIPYDAIALGDQEFFRGVSFLSGMMEGSALPFVSTNLTGPQLPDIKRKVIVARSGVSFGILSILDSRVFRFYPARIRDSIEIDPYENLLSQAVDELRGAVDVIVLLSHLGIDEDRQLPEKIPGIDIIVGSHTQTVMEEPEKIGNTIIVQAGKDGYYVGRLKLTFDDEKKIESYAGDLVAMDIGLPNDSAVVAMIVEYNRLNRIRVGKRVQRISPVPASFLVASSGNCGVCHEDQQSHWSTTGH
ncbi:MAG: hypothetical protein ACE5GH_07565, partial [Fidelibacterota bacterium]